MFVGSVLAVGLLLPAVARAARHSKSAAAVAGAEVCAHGERVLGRAARAAEAADGQRAQDVEDALRVSQALWAHSEARPCLELAVSRPHIAELKPSGSSLVERVWALETKHEVLDGLGGSLLAYLHGEVAAKISREAAHHKEVAAAEVKELGALKDLLKEVYGFSYDAQKEACARLAAGRLQAAVDQVEAELTTGCAGTCSKKSTVVRECRETSEQPCPEGTSCRCRMTRKTGLAAAVGTVSYLLTTGALMYILGPAGAVVPGPMEMAGLSSFLVATRAEGCRCMLSTCTWDAGRQACAPAPAKVAENPFQAALPYVGQVCAQKSEGLRAVAISAAPRLVNPGCELRPCGHGDAARVGKFGNDTFNCQQASAPVKEGEISFQDLEEDPEIAFPPLGDRLQTYARVPRVPRARHHGGQASSAVGQEEEEESEVSFQDEDEDPEIAVPKLFPKFTFPKQRRDKEEEEESDVYFQDLDEHPEIAVPKFPKFEGQRRVEEALP